MFLMTVSARTSAGQVHCRIPGDGVSLMGFLWPVRVLGFQADQGSLIFINDGVGVGHCTDGTVGADRDNDIALWPWCYLSAFSRHGYCLGCFSYFTLYCVIAHTCSCPHKHVYLWR